MYIERFCLCTYTNVYTWWSGQKCCHAVREVDLMALRGCTLCNNRTPSKSTDKHCPCMFHHEWHLIV